MYNDPSVELSQPSCFQRVGLQGGCITNLMECLVPPYGSNKREGLEGHHRIQRKESHLLALPKSLLSVFAELYGVVSRSVLVGEFVCHSPGDVAARSCGPSTIGAICFLAPG